MEIELHSGTVEATQEAARLGALEQIDKFAKTIDKTNTAAAYRRDLIGLFEWLVKSKVHADDISGSDLAEFAKTPIVDRKTGELKAPAASTQLRRIAAVRRFYLWARDQGLTSANPEIDKSRRPKVHQNPAAKLGLDRGQVRDLYRSALASGPKAVALVDLLASCGFRISEVVNADVADIKTIRGVQTLTVVGKGDKARTVRLPDHVVHSLDAYLDGRTSGPLFTTSTGNRLGRRGAYDLLCRVADRAGFTTSTGDKLKRNKKRRKAGPPFHPHLLRHTAATSALERGAPLDRVQILLGHASPTTTMQYVKGRDQIDNSAALDAADWYGLDEVDDELVAS